MRLTRHNGSHLSFTPAGKHFILGLCAGAALLFAIAFAAASWGIQVGSTEVPVETE